MEGKPTPVVPFANLGYKPTRTSETALGEFVGRLGDRMVRFAEEALGEELDARIARIRMHPNDAGVDPFGFDPATARYALALAAFLHRFYFRSQVFGTENIPEGRVLVIANHWSCCTADDNRQEQADALISFLRDARTSGGVIDLAPDTPILAAGDFNLVGWRRQLETLTTGDIVDEGTFGPDSPPDWDGSEFDRAEVRHPDTRFVYTWRNDGGSFYPGQLDYIWFTGSVATLHRSLTVETRTMLSSSLAEFGLGAGDTETASDHAAVFADFSFDDTSSVEHLPISGEPRLSWLAARPNPFLGSTDLRFELETSATVSVSIYDVSGREVRRLVDGDRLDAGPHGYHWDGTDSDGRQVPAGAYVYEVRAEGEVLGSTLVRLH